MPSVSSRQVWRIPILLLALMNQGGKGCNVIVQRLDSKPFSGRNTQRKVSSPRRGGGSNELPVFRSFLLDKMVGGTIMTKIQGMLVSLSFVVGPSMVASCQSTAPAQEGKNCPDVGTCCCYRSEVDDYACRRAAICQGDLNGVCVEDAKCIFH